MVDFKTLEAIVWINRAGSFRAAAERLHTTQPALSHRVQRLEQELGVSLFQRQRPHIALTEKGRQAVHFADQLLELRARMIETVGRNEAFIGSLRLGVSETIVHTWLPEFVKQMSKDFPHLDLEMDVDDSPSLKSRLAAFELDLAFVAGPSDETIFDSLLLSRCSVRFVCSPALGLSVKTTLRDIANWPILTFSRTSQMHPMVKSLFGAPDMPRTRIHSSSSIATIVRMALDGIGVALIPTAIIRKEVEAGDLIELVTSPFLPDLSFSAVWLKSFGSGLAKQAAQIAATTASQTIYR